MVLCCLDEQQDFASRHRAAYRNLWTGLCEQVGTYHENLWTFLCFKPVLRIMWLNWKSLFVNDFIMWVTQKNILIVEASKGRLVKLIFFLIKYFYFFSQPRSHVGGSTPFSVWKDMWKIPVEDVQCLLWRLISCFRSGRICGRSRSKMYNAYFED